MLSMEGEGKTTKVCIEKIMLVTLANHLTKILNHKIFFKFPLRWSSLLEPYSKNEMIYLLYYINIRRLDLAYICGCRY